MIEDAPEAGSADYAEQFFLGSARFNYRVDFKCGSILVETKALDALSSVHLSQVINYLKASGLQRGLLINFGTRHLEYKRVIWSSR